MVPPCPLELVPPRPLELVPPRPFVLVPPRVLELVSPRPLPLVPNELNRSPKDDIRSPPRLPSPMSPRPDDAGGLKREEPVVEEVVGVAFDAEGAEGEEYEVEEGGVARGVVVLVRYEGVVEDALLEELELARGLYDCKTTSFLLLRDENMVESLPADVDVPEDE